MHHPVHVTIRYTPVSNLNDSTDFSFPLRSSSCIQRLDWSQLPATIVQLYPTTRPISAHPHQTSSCISTTRPTSATLVERPAAHIYNSTIPAIDITHTTASDIYIYVCNSGNKIVIFVVSVILPLCPLHCLWLSQLARLNLQSFVESTRLSAPQQALVMLGHSHWLLYRSWVCHLTSDSCYVYMYCRVCLIFLSSCFQGMREIKCLQQLRHDLVRILVRSQTVVGLTWIPGFLKILWVALKIFASVVYGYFQLQNEYQIWTDFLNRKIRCSRPPFRWDCNFVLLVFWPLMQKIWVSIFHLRHHSKSEFAGVCGDFCW